MELEYLSEISQVQKKTKMDVPSPIWEPLKEVESRMDTRGRSMGRGDRDWLMVAKIQLEIK